jgi:hypothetical protein
MTHGPLGYGLPNTANTKDTKGWHTAPVQTLKGNSRKYASDKEITRITRAWTIAE